MSAVDQGMAYELCAMIANPDVLEPVAQAHPGARLVVLEHGFVMIPVTEQLAGSLQEAGGAEPVAPESGFWMISPGVQALLVAASHAGPVGYLEADYWGQWGRQTAVVWRDGAVAIGPLILGPREPFPPAGASPIAIVLHSLGVPVVGRRDPFVVAGLGRRRHTEAWD